MRSAQTARTSLRPALRATKLGDADSFSCHAEAEKVLAEVGLAEDYKAAQYTDAVRAVQAIREAEPDRPCGESVLIADRVTWLMVGRS